MPPSISPYIDLEIGGKVRRLRWKFRALKAIEEALPGSNALSGLAGLFENLTASRAVVFIWAGMLHEHFAKDGTCRSEAPPTIDDVSDWLDGETFELFVRKLGEMGQPDTQGTPQEPPPANPPSA